MRHGDDKEIQRLLKEAFPPVDRELRRDLWPAMLGRLEALDLQCAGTTGRFWHCCVSGCFFARKGFCNSFTSCEAEEP